MKKVRGWVGIFNIWKKEEKKEGKGPFFFVFLEHKQSMVIYPPQKCPDFILHWFVANQACSA